MSISANFKLIGRRQLNSTMQALQQTDLAQAMPKSWVKTLRQALGITQQQLAAKLNLTKQSITDLERREINKSITLQRLEAVAEALDMKLVYGFVPKDGSLENLMERKAEELARKIVLRTDQTMKLEDQANSAVQLEMAVKERAAQLKAQMPKQLWD